MDASSRKLLIFPIPSVYKPKRTVCEPTRFCCREIDLQQLSLETTPRFVLHFSLTRTDPGHSEFFREVALTALTRLSGRLYVISAYADQWALITGASSGIGAEFARRLASRGMHLILIARRKDLLEQLAVELHTAHGTKCEIIVSDLSDPAQPAAIAEEVARRQINVELLINNAGFGYVSEIETVDLPRVEEMIQVNITALTKLTYRFLGGMMQRGHGGVINTSSVAAFQPVAYMGAYAASKAYVLHFSEALWAEARESGVTVLALCPGPTRTDFFDVAGAKGWLTKKRSQSAEEVVRIAIRALEKKKQYVVCGWINYILSLAVRLANRRTVVRESMKFFRPAKAK
ncbi:MAG: Short-chain dehydrogenase [Planctomycetaceae bacterium]|nr:Short-chain dehydrogenase [Planctomycetaceae bacterium]